MNHITDERFLVCETFYMVLAFVAGSCFAGSLFVLLLLSGSLACQ